MNQLAIDFDAPPIYRPERAARRSDPATSHKAAQQARALAADHHGRILAALQRGPAGKSAIAARIGLDGHQVGKRMAEMQRAGLVKLTGATVTSESGRAEREWVAA
jgi:predicted Rossmann fold nucleotide-binding protein DprA/Smf involved in DNA uptake